MILCDIGNTTFHFLILSGNQKEFKISINDDLGDLDFPNYGNYDIYFISVNEEATKRFQARFPKSVNLENKINFKTNYSSTLGIDRVVACKFLSEGIVADFGSAITVDIVKNGIHLGGYIFPGFEMLCKIYPQISNKLSFDFETEMNLDKIPENTNAAISMSIIQMIITPIKELQKKHNTKIIITGETAKYFSPYIDKFEIRKRLIFENMKNIIEEIK